MVLLHDPVDVAHGRAHEESKDESDIVVAMGPDVDVDGVKREEQREAP